MIKNKLQIHPSKSKYMIIGSSYNLKNKLFDNNILINDVPIPHCNFIGAILAPRGRFGFLEVGPFWLHTGVKIEHWGHFGTRMGYFGPTLRGRFCHV